jgi:C4-dicarboxylate-specific signal transduction histidine kinase
MKVFKVIDTAGGEGAATAAVVAMFSDLGAAAVVEIELNQISRRTTDLQPRYVIDEEDITIFNSVEAYRIHRKMDVRSKALAKLTHEEKEALQEYFGG